MCLSFSAACIDPPSGPQHRARYPVFGHNGDERKIQKEPIYRAAAIKLFVQ